MKCNTYDIVAYRSIGSKLEPQPVIVLPRFNITLPENFQRVQIYNVFSGEYIGLPFTTHEDNLFPIGEGEPGLQSKKGNVSKYTQLQWKCPTCKRLTGFNSPIKATGDLFFWGCSECGDAITLSDKQIEKQLTGTTLFPHEYVANIDYTQFHSVPNLKKDVDKPKSMLDFWVNLRTCFLGCALPVNEEDVIDTINAAFIVIEDNEKLTAQEKAAMKERVGRRLKSALAEAILIELPY
jgi:hypothetical protein